MDQNWLFLLSEFRSLGGIADNVCQKDGDFGRGIFPSNPNKRSRIYIPWNLMIHIDDIYLEGKKLRIKRDKKYSQEIRNFFDYYQDNFSWGGGGKEKVESFEKQLSLFGSRLKLSASTSAKIGIAPIVGITSALAAKVNDGTITP